MVTGRRVVVITGASSGIGRITARAFAADGCNVVVAARSDGSLAEVVDECQWAGGRAVAVRADITRDGDVESILETAIDAFGHVDVWVNAAAVMAYGQFPDVPLEVHRKVLETNLIGTISCARVALRHFLIRGSGALINVASLYGKMTSPYVSAYVTSKFGLIGFNEVLRQELSRHPGITTSVVLPGSVNTPIFRHSATYAGRGPRPVPPVSDPQRVARAIVRCARRPRPKVVVGQTARVLAWGHALFPSLYDRLAPLAMDAVGLVDEPAEDSPGNVFEPMPEWNRVDGSWRRLPRVWTATLVGGGMAAAAMGARWRLARSAHPP